MKEKKKLKATHLKKEKRKKKKEEKGEKVGMTMSNKGKIIEYMIRKEVIDGK